MEYSFYDKMKYLIGKAAVYLILLMFPIVFSDKFKNITATRYYFFIYTAFICFGVFAVSGIIHVIRTRQTWKSLKTMLSKGYVRIGVALLISVWIAYLITPYKEYAFSGKGSRYIGVVFFSACISLYLVVSACYVFGKADIILALTVASLENVLAILNFVGIDPLGFFTSMKETAIDQFISLMGNINIFGAYTILMAVISMYLYMVETQMKHKILYFIYAALGVMGVIVSNSDSAGLGLIVFLVFVPFLVCRNAETIRDYMMILIMVLFSGKLIGAILLLSSERVRGLDSIVAGIVYNKLFYVFLFILIAAVVYINLKRDEVNQKLTKELLKNTRKGYLIFLGVLIAAMFAAVIYYSAVDTETDIGRWSTYFRMNDEWGSDRGFIWVNLLNGYAHMPLLHEIFGMGEGTASCILSDYASVHWNLISGSLVDNAHNIPLQMLVTTGVVGMGIYIYMIWNGIREIVKAVKQKRNITENVYGKWMVAMELGVLCYFFQSCFNLLETFTFPILICILGMINAMREEQMYEKK